MNNIFLKYKSVTVSLGFLFIILIISKIFIFSTNESTDSVSIIELKPIGQQPYIPSKLVFANQDVPLQHNDVKESLDRELLSNAYWHSQTILLLKRAHRYFPAIEPILKKYGIPDDFKYIPLIESGFLNIGSPAGARGYWQLIDGTAKENGLEVDDDVDERNHIEKSTEAACKFFIQAYDKFQSWPMAAASYNMGVTGLNNQVKSQGTNNFYDLWLNTETGRYVFRIIAMKLIFENPTIYGFHLKEDNLYKPIPTKTIEVDSSIASLFSFAKSQGLSYKAFKTYNPWLVSTKLQNKSGKKYLIAIPEEGFRDITFDSNE
jgi:hypothetical protein